MVPHVLTPPGSSRRGDQTGTGWARCISLLATTQGADMVPVTHRRHPYDASERAPDHHDPRNGGVAPGQISQRRGPPLSQTRDCGRPPPGSKTSRSPQVSASHNPTPQGNWSVWWCDDSGRWDVGAPWVVTDRGAWPAVLLETRIGRDLLATIASDRGGGPVGG